MGKMLTRHQDIKKDCKNIDFITGTLLYNLNIECVTSLGFHYHEIKN